MSQQTAQSALLHSQPQAIHAYQQLMQQGLGAVTRWLSASSTQLYSGLSVAELQSAITLHATEQGLGAELAIQHAVSTYLQHSLAVHHPHCVAHLHCPTLVISQVAELLMNASNQSLDSWDQSPSASVMEIKLIEWLRRQVGYAQGDAGVFTSGGTQSNLMGLLLARDRLVQQHWQRCVQTHGLPADSHRIKVLCSANAHFSVQKNMALLGLGSQAVVSVAVDAHGRMDVHALRQSIQRLQEHGQVIAAIVATAGTTDAGAIDPLAQITQLAQQHGIWLHVDAAWGGALLLSQRYRQRLNGIELADSITLDFHKHFFQPISCGAFLLKNPEDYRLMHQQAEYLNSAFDEAQGVPNLVAKSLQTTRRFDALKLWMSIEALGLKQLSQLIEHGIELAQQIAQLIAQTPELQLMQQPQLSSVLFRVTPSTIDASRWDELNQSVADRLLSSGQANVGVTRYQQCTVLKLTLLNPMTQLSDLAQLLAAVQQQAERFVPRQQEVYA
jgi:L-2,4-diaminobutyrate decarboxylase